MNNEEIMLEQYKESIKALSNRKRLPITAIYTIALVILIITSNVFHLTRDQLLLAFGVYILFISLYYFIVQFRTSFWTQTACKILKKEVEVRGNESFFPRVYYIYTVNGQKYISDKVNYDPLGNSKIWKAEDKMKIYEEGRSYDCYYNFRKPEQAVLINKLSYYPIILFCIGVAAILFSSTLKYF